AQLHELDYDVGYDHPPLPDHSDFHGGPSCSFGSSRPLDGHPIRNIGALVAISTTEGADAWLTDPNRAGAELASSATIEGFPALVLPHPVLRDDCMVVVDTADKQYIEVSVGPDTGRDTVRKPYCDEAKRVSAMAIRTLTGRGEK
ncbi:DUF3558 family protein, partial [Actinophytocola sp.]|uniref:DUF3558 family protein n=1 Tax=Actinophytocola sp. TaxID=1872138 RepID=UPI002ED8D790